jgi:hypothetical protein
MSPERRTFLWGSLAGLVALIHGAYSAWAGNKAPAHGDSIKKFSDVFPPDTPKTYRWTECRPKKETDYERVRAGQDIPAGSCVYRCEDGFVYYQCPTYAITVQDIKSGEAGLAQPVFHPSFYIVPELNKR